MSSLPPLSRIASVLVGIAIVVTTLAMPGRARADDADAGMRERLAGCAVCHGDRGQGAHGAEYFPHLAGKPAGYLLEQMRAFRDGKRHYAQMIYLMQYLDDAWLAEVADWYAAQPPIVKQAESGTPMREVDVARARQLVFDGDPAKGLTACSACHGRALAGLEPGVPALVGLPTEYIIAQFGGWITGVRQSTVPDCMASIARKLEPTDLRIVATWLSRQAAPDGERPAAAGTRALPLACGDLPVEAAR